MPAMIVTDIFPWLGNGGSLDNYHESEISLFRTCNYKKEFRFDFVPSHPRRRSLDKTQIASLYLTGEVVTTKVNLSGMNLSQ